MVRPSRTDGKIRATKARKAKGRTTPRTKRIAPTDIQSKRSSTSILEELNELREQQAATAEILKIINASPGNLAAVFDTILEKAHSLCDVPCGSLQLLDGDHTRAVAVRGMSEPFEKFLRQGYRLDRKQPVQLVRPFQIEDLAKVVAGAPHGSPLRIAFDLGCIRTMLSVPLVRDAVVLGRIVAARQEVRPFSERQIAVLQSFANQAVIAIENARLFSEVQAKTGELTARNEAYSEQIDHQSATIEILKAMSASPGDAQAVFDVIVQRALLICNSDIAVVLGVDGQQVHLRSIAIDESSISPDVLQAYRSIFPQPPSRDSVALRAILHGEIIHIPNVTDDLELSQASRDIGSKGALALPLICDGIIVGSIGLSAKAPGGFSETQIALLKTFAEQAVIAVRSAEAFRQLHARTNELSEALQQQTATADVLKVISRSTFELQTVLDTLTESAARLCGADMATVCRQDIAGFFYNVTNYNFPDDWIEYSKSFRMQPERGSVVGRALLAGGPVQIADVFADPEYTYHEQQRRAGFRTLLSTPLLRNEQPIGVFILGRKDVRPFDDKQMALVTTFADQAVIAIENVRLIEELRERQAELRVTFDNMGDGVVMFGADKKLVAWNRNLQQMLDLPDALLISRPSFAEFFRYLAARGEFGSADLEAELSRSLEDTGREMRYERTRPDGRVVEVRRNPVPDGGFVLIYADITERKRAEQAIRLARDTAEKALRDLQAAQDRLIQTEKLASLGQLTAGIAHEIKNPLNFVNNFSSLSAELTDELNDTLKGAALTDKLREEVSELTKLLKENLAKVVQHGKRADSIVKNMLLHSREGSREQRPTDVNVLVDESLDLAYHGARAEKSGFEIVLQRDFDPKAGTIELFPQEVSRALLNLLSNGFYAAAKRKADSGGAGAEPTIRAITKNLGSSVEIRIRDNGTGIQPEVREKMFNPFFTTKPTGEGTGLGLSMTHDIIVMQHGGRIDVETEPGEFTEFIITLPRKGSAP